MKTATTFSIPIWINASRAKNDEAEIFAIITVNQKRTNISLKRKINAASWDKAKSRIKGNSQEARILNQYLDQELSKLFQCFQDLRLADKLVTPQAIKSKFLGLDITYHSLQQLINYQP